MNNNVLTLFFTAIISILLLLYACDKSVTTNQDYYKKGSKLSSEELSLIQSGDIILRQGYGAVSSMIIKTLNEDIPVSHIGVISQDEKGDFFVIHSVSRAISDHDGIQIDEFERFLKHSRPNSVIITRYKGSNPDNENTGYLISKRAQYYLDKKIPFDHTFNLEDSTAFFCSELVYRILTDLFDDNVFDCYITERLIDKLRFSPFYDYVRFDIIVNHH